MSIRYNLIKMKAAVSGMKAAVEDMVEAYEARHLPPVLRVPGEYRETAGITHSAYAARF